MKDIREVQAEGRALYSALEAVEGKASQAKDDIAAFLRNFAPEDSIEGLAKSAAMRIICEIPFEAPLSYSDPENDLEVLCQLWTRWAIENKISEVPPLQNNFGRSLEQLVLQQWRTAIKSLFKADLSSAKRLYLRATHLGSEYGTQSHLVIQWTYVATFFPRPTLCRASSIS